eukprot:764489-Hanusia_phi.AAC.2
MAATGRPATEEAPPSDLRELRSRVGPGPTHWHGPIMRLRDSDRSGPTPDDAADPGDTVLDTEAGWVRPYGTAVTGY